jgi:hypothetical protein
MPEQMSERDERIVMLRDVYGMAMKDIACIEGLTTSTVSSLYSKAQAKESDRLAAIKPEDTISYRIRSWLKTNGPATTNDVGTAFQVDPRHAASLLKAIDGIVRYVEKRPVIGSTRLQGQDKFVYTVVDNDSQESL